VKATRKPVLKIHQGKCGAEIGSEIHSALLATKVGRKYCIAFSGDKTKLTSLHLLKSKDEAFYAYKDFEAWCKTQFSK